MAPTGTRGVINDAPAIYFQCDSRQRVCDALVYRAAIAEGLFRVREDAPKLRVPAKAHKSPL
jgi:hypothetical protein